MFDHTYIDNRAPKTLVLLHGTGGSKSDLLFLDQPLNHSFNLLGLQGNVLENGMPRFFWRLGMGVFDQENIKEEAEKLRQFLEKWQQDHGQTAEDCVFLGYSNGANMILATLFLYPDSMFTAALLHPMLPFTPESLSLEKHSVFVSSGEYDPMVSTDQQAQLVDVLKKSGARVTTKIYSGGHEISAEEWRDVMKFLQQFQ